jgi:hypothetical protein
MSTHLTVFLGSFVAWNMHQAVQQGFFLSASYSTVDSLVKLYSVLDPRWFNADPVPISDADPSRVFSDSDST